MEWFKFGYIQGLGYPAVGSFGFGPLPPLLSAGQTSFQNSFLITAAVRGVVLVELPKGTDGRGKLLEG